MMHHLTRVQTVRRLSFCPNTVKRFIYASVSNINEFSLLFSYNIILEYTDITDEIICDSI